MILLVDATVAVGIMLTVVVSADTDDNVVSVCVLTLAVEIAVAVGGLIGIVAVSLIAG